MPLAPGTLLGPYEIVAPIGAGGMGEVYKARDTRLDRFVAVKQAKEQFGERFEREAHAVAALNHPNICTLFDVGPNYLVMEFIEGPTLAERMTAGPLPLPEALAAARQIAEALEAAHEKGIVHRDLKPANIKLTPDGKVKVLDFGLARATDDERAASSPENSPTLTLSATRAGVILGTAGYMSPEQARGLAVDKRTDIWAFGVVLLEMLTGRLTFTGETVSDTLAAVLRADFEWTALPADTPDSIRRLLRRCLQRDRKRRLRDIGDAIVEIDESSTEPGHAPSATAGPVDRRRWLPWICVSVLVLGMLTLGSIHWREAPPDRRAVQVEIHAPEGLTLGSPGVYNFAIDQGGRKVVFAATAKDGRSVLYLRSVESNVSAPLTGTESGTLPFWAPDGRWLGFFANGKLMKLDTTAGVVQPICDASSPRSGGTWNREGLILFASYGGPLQKVYASGGTPAPVLPKEENQKNPDQRDPQFLPDDRHFLYIAFGEKSGIRVGALDGSPPRFVMPNSLSPAFYAPPVGRGPGFLLFMRQNQLMAQAFDAEKAQLTGDAVPVTSPLSSGPQFHPAGADLLVRRTNAAATQMTWVDRDGKPLGKLGEPGTLYAPRISPDGKSVAVSRSEANNYDVWVHDLERGTAARLTFEPGSDLYAVWSPDSQAIAYRSTRGTESLLVMRATGGVGVEKILFRQSQSVVPTAFSRDGHWVVAMPRRGEATTAAILVPTTGEGESVPVLRRAFEERDAQISPDGQWLLFSSSPNGRREVFVQSLPESVGGPPGVGHWQISNNGGLQPAWRADGKEIFYIGDGAMMAVSVESGRAQFKPGLPKRLFSTQIAADTLIRQYDVSADGRRFLLAQPMDQAAAEPLTVILNWQSLLK
jgi:serine/threonine protein kinase/Tol biopolymer transport system component